MSTMPSSSTGEPFSNLGRAELSRFMQMGLIGPRRSVDELVDHLARDNAHTWLARMLKVRPIAAFGSPRQQLYKGCATLEQLTTIKQESKELRKRARDQDTRLCAILAYFLSIAAALVHHGALISSRTRGEIDPILLDLAEVMPRPWSNLLGRAALVNYGDEPRQTA